MSFNWQQFHADNTHVPTVVDPRRRLRICLAGFAALLLLVFGRAVQLEVTQGAGFRAAALRPIERETVLPAARGRILARDGTVLAYDRAVAGRGRRVSLAGGAGGRRLAAGPGPGPVAEGGSQESEAARRRPKRGPGGAQGIGSAASRLVRPFVGTVGRPGAAHPGPRRTDCRGRQSPPAIPGRTAGSRPMTRGQAASAGCCWKTRRRRALSWPKSWTITLWPTTFPRRLSRRSRTTPTVIPARKS